MTKERPTPYVGISGVSESRPYELGDHMAQYWLMDQYAYSGLADHRQLTLGVKAVHKTQYLDIENKYGREWYPVGEEFTQALSPAWSINIAQICFDQECVRDPNYRDEFIGRVHRRGKKWLDALQFDLLPWHEDDSMLPFLEDVKEKTEPYGRLPAPVTYHRQGAADRP